MDYVKASILIAGLSLAGCEKIKSPEYEIDSELRIKLFQSCMASLPAGPVQTHYNDWNEVIRSCDAAAMYQARYCYENCPPSRAALAKQE